MTKENNKNIVYNYRLYVGSMFNIKADIDYYFDNIYIEDLGYSELEQIGSQIEEGDSEGYVTHIDKEGKEHIGWWKLVYIE